MPSGEEAIAFGDSAMRLINGSLDDSRRTKPDKLAATYKALSHAPKGKSRDDELIGVVNIITAVDVRHPARQDDSRSGGVQEHFIARDRAPHRMQLMSKEELAKRYPDVKIATPKE